MSRVEACNLLFSGLCGGTYCKLGVTTNTWYVGGQVITTSHDLTPPLACCVEDVHELALYQSSGMVVS